MSAAAPLTNSRTLPPAVTWRLNAMTTWAIPVTSRYAPNTIAATRIEMPGQARTMTPRITARSPDISADFQRCGNRAGGAWVVILEVFHSAYGPDKNSQATRGKFGPPAQ